MTESRWFSHPVWLAGFRPFFALAFVSGALYPLWWAAVFAGWLSLPSSAPMPMLWHGHEMFYGFGWAVLGGFLLTASKNWVGVRGIHGGLLALATFLWLVERATVPFSADLPFPVKFVLLNASVLFIGAYVSWTLIRHRRQDSFPDNYYFLVALPVFLVAKNLMADLNTFATGSAMTIGLFRLAFVVMLERTMPQFMRNAMKTPLPRHRLLDHPIKALTLVAVFEPFLPTPLAAAALIGAGTVLLVRFFLWHPIVGFRRFEIGLMYVGYLGLALHMGLEAARLLGNPLGIGSLATHTFTFLTMGIIIPGMLIRICQGHTGRKLLFTRSDRVGIWAIGLAAFFRLVATQVWPAHYATWIVVAALGWTVCFTLLGIRLLPFLFQPRVDGKVH